MRLYGEYLAERQNLKVIEKDFGFAAYKISGAECYLAEIFVQKGSRQAGLGKQLLSEVLNSAVEAKCKLLTANIYTWDPGATETMRAALAVGFKIKSSAVNVILVSLEFGGE